MRKILLFLVAGLLVQGLLGVALADPTYSMSMSSLKGYNRHITYNGGDMHVGCGVLAGTFDGGPIADLFCVDLDHTFGWSDSWYTYREVVPPDPASPPPFNTKDAMYAYFTYRPNWSGSGTAGKQWAAGTQMALWEITQESSWSYSSNWYSTGMFQDDTDYHGNDAIRQNADTILQAVDSWSGTPTQYGYYYQPTDAPPGQGFIGDVPEPGTLFLMGGGMLVAGVLAWRKRRRS